MFMFNKNAVKASFKVIHCFVIVCFLIDLVLPMRGFGQMLNLSQSGSLISLSPSYTPALLTGIQVHPENPLQFDFIINDGDDDLQGESLQQEAQKMIKYFLASLTVPEKDLWVNLSPYEKDRIIPEGLSRTDVGRELLAQDYVLKQITASLIYPEGELGKKFWDRIYKKAYEAYGTTEVPIDTFNKVWIMPDKVVVYEHGNMVFVAEASFKVMLEEDYVALQRSAESRALDARGVAAQESQKSKVKSQSALLNTNDQRLTTSTLSSQIVREIVIPELQKEVNKGKNFASLRQVYNALILAVWFKQALKESLLGKIYVDQNKTAGINITDSKMKERIYQQYLNAYQKGVYNYIKPEYDQYTQKNIPRKYFSGGIEVADAVRKNLKTISSPTLAQENNIVKDGHNTQFTAALVSADNETMRLAIKATPTKVLVPELSGQGTEEAENFLHRKYHVPSSEIRINPDETEITARITTTIETIEGDQVVGGAVFSLTKKDSNWFLFIKTKDPRPDTWGVATNAHKRGNKFTAESAEEVIVPTEKKKAVSPTELAYQRYEETAPVQIGILPSNAVVRKDQYFLRTLFAMTSVVSYLSLSNIYKRYQEAQLPPAQGIEAVAVPKNITKDEEDVIRGIFTAISLQERRSLASVYKGVEETKLPGMGEFDSPKLSKGEKYILRAIFYWTSLAADIDIGQVYEGFEKARSLGEDSIQRFKLANVAFGTQLILKAIFNLNALSTGRDLSAVYDEYQKTKLPGEDSAVERIKYVNVSQGDQALLREMFEMTSAVSSSSLLGVRTGEIIIAPEYEIIKYVRQAYPDKKVRNYIINTEGDATPVFFEGFPSAAWKKERKKDDPILDVTINFGDADQEQYVTVEPHFPGNYSSWRVVQVKGLEKGVAMPSVYVADVVRKKNLIPRAERIAKIKAAGYSLFGLPSRDVFIDFLTDSGTGAMSNNQAAAMMLHDESYAGSESYERMENSIKEILGFPYLLPTHQGRAAENIINLGMITKEKNIVVGNPLFDTTTGHVLSKGGVIVEIPVKESAELDSNFPFKGNIDIDALRKTLTENKGKVAYILATITDNMSGGQPVSLTNLKAVRALANEFNVPLFGDIARFAENAYFIKERDPGYQDKSIRDIVKEMMSVFDAVQMSAKKDGLTPMGGFIAMRSKEDKERFIPFVIYHEGFLNYGGISGKDMEIIAEGFQEVVDEDYLKDRIEQARYLGTLLHDAGVPVRWPIGGHGVFIDGYKFFNGRIPKDQFPAQALGIALYEEGGIRGIEIGSLVKGRYADGSLIGARHEFLRLAIPRRVYNKEHLKYVADIIINLYKSSRKDRVPGFKVIEGRNDALMHFTAKLAPVAGPASEEKAGSALKVDDKLQGAVNMVVQKILENNQRAQSISSEELEQVKILFGGSTKETLFLLDDNQSNTLTGLWNDLEDYNNEDVVYITLQFGLDSITVVPENPDKVPHTVWRVKSISSALSFSEKLDTLTIPGSYRTPSVIAQKVFDVFGWAENVVVNDDIPLKDFDEDDDEARTIDFQYAEGTFRLIRPASLKENWTVEKGASSTLTIPEISSKKSWQDLAQALTAAANGQTRIRSTESWIESLNIDSKNKKEGRFVPINIAESKREGVRNHHSKVRFTFTDGSFVIFVPGRTNWEVEEAQGVSVAVSGNGSIQAKVSSPAASSKRMISYHITMDLLEVYDQLLSDIEIMVPGEEIIYVDVNVKNNNTAKKVIPGKELALYASENVDAATFYFNNEDYLVFKPNLKNERWEMVNAYGDRAERISSGIIAIPYLSAELPAARIVEKVNYVLDQDLMHSRVRLTNEVKKQVLMDMHRISINERQYIGEICLSYRNGYRVILEKDTKLGIWKIRSFTDREGTAIDFYQEGVPSKIEALPQKVPVFSLKEARTLSDVYTVLKQGIQAIRSKTTIEDVFVSPLGNGVVRTYTTQHLLDQYTFNNFGSATFNFTNGDFIVIEPNENDLQWRVVRAFGASAQSVAQGIVLQGASSSLPTNVSSGFSSKQVQQFLLERMKLSGWQVDRVDADSNKVSIRQQKTEKGRPVQKRTIIAKRERPGEKWVVTVSSSAIGIKEGDLVKEEGAEALKKIQTAYPDIMISHVIVNFSDDERLRLDFADNRYSLEKMWDQVDGSDDIVSVEIHFKGGGNRYVKIVPLSSQNFAWKVQKIERLPQRRGMATPVPAVIASAAVSSPTGGIDFAGIYENLNIKTDANGSPLAVQFQELEKVHIDGLIPVIIQVMPVSNLPFLLGFEREDEVQQIVSAKKES